ncbi:MAG: TSUP family transporter [Spirochaetes bacterium]|nr:TSUP family transporter [Spirochaetota bacterium]
MIDFLKINFIEILNNNHNIILLTISIFFAGFIDSIAGGGGLISMPAYIAFGIPGHFILGTNKFSSTSGTLFATFKFAYEKKILYKTGLISVFFAFIGSLIGSRLVLLIPTIFIKYLLIILLPIITLLSIIKRDTQLTGLVEEPIFKENINFYIKASLLCFLIGVYDGFFGPATGTFIILVYNHILKIDLVHSSGTAKIVNLSSNVAALIVFLIKGVVYIKIGIICAIAGIIGNFLGASFAIKRGSKIIKPIYLFVLLLLFTKIIIDTFK